MLFCRRRRCWSDIGVAGSVLICKGFVTIGTTAGTSFMVVRVFLSLSAMLVTDSVTVVSPPRLALIESLPVFIGSRDVFWSSEDCSAWLSIVTLLYALSIHSRLTVVNISSVD